MLLIQYIHNGMNRAVIIVLMLLHYVGHVKQIIFFYCKYNQSGLHCLFTRGKRSVTVLLLTRDDFPVSSSQLVRYYCRHCHCRGQAAHYSLSQVLFLSHLDDFNKNVHTCERSTNRMDERQTIQDFLLTHYHFPL